MLIDRVFLLWSDDVIEKIVDGRGGLHRGAPLVPSASMISVGLNERLAIQEAQDRFLKPHIAIV